MNIYALVKRTFDTEEKITISNHAIEEEQAEYIINPYDEYAIEEAIQVRDACGGEVTVITIGGEEAEKQLRTALAMGADKAVLINTEECTGEMDESSIAKMAAYYLQDKEADLIFAGNVAIDGGSGQVGPRIADLLGINYVTTATNIEIDGESVKIVRDVEGDSETIETSLPVLITAQQGLNEPRYPSLPGIMKAKKKPLEEIDADDLDIDEEELEAKKEVIDVFLPAEKAAGKILEGELSNQAAELVELLIKEAKVI